jgi:hypothetical protein
MSLARGDDASFDLGFRAFRTVPSNADAARLGKLRDLQNLRDLRISSK